MFSIKHYLSAQEREQISSEIGLKPNQVLVQLNFQNNFLKIKGQNLVPKSPLQN